LIIPLLTVIIHRHHRMGKQGKGKTNGKPRAGPYVKKATVDVHYEGEAAAPATATKPQPKSKSQVTVPIPAPAEALTPAKSEKSKGKQRATPTTIVPGSFIIVAGSYEKLLYGIEGAYPAANEDSGDGLVNKVVKPDLTPIFIFPAHLAFVKAIAASPGGKWLATGSEDEFIKVWDLRRRKEVGSLSQHTGMSLCLCSPQVSS
jgi:protein MAK11